MKYRLDGFSLKVIAIAAMAIDHIAAVFFPWALWMRVIGRLTMPIMAYMVAEGYHYTKSVKRYLLRLLIFAAISQIPFSLAFGTSTFNVLFTLSAAVCILALDTAQIPKVLKLLLSAALLIFSVFCDWAVFGVLFVCVFYRFRGNFKTQAMAFSVVAGAYLVLLAFTVSGYTYLVEAGVLFALPILSLYNGKRGQDMRYLFYIFYPAHLALIALINFLV